jgi:uncharacterized protein with NRDE domain
MCTVVILYRPKHPWPVIMAANRDEMASRPSAAPARHWPDRPHVVAGIDKLADGTWLGLNDYGLVAGVLNRRHSLGPQKGFRSRGELPLEALDHAEAALAADALSDLDPSSFRAFNMIIADRKKAFWLSSANQEENGAEAAVQAAEIPPGLSMITAYDCNDLKSPRIKMYLPRFQAAAAPDPEAEDWAAWKSLLSSSLYDAEVGPEGAMNIVANAQGFGTVSSSLIALPSLERPQVKPVWLFGANPLENPEFDKVCL